MKEKGILLHAKHAFMPNSLGYCGPDDRGLILRHLEESRGGEALVSTLKEFEAAYPFLKLIARNTGREVFDYAVPEAYWIGNSLLDRVPVQDFHSFSHRELAGRDPREVKRVFGALGGQARPHHSFYVMSTYASSSVADGPNLANEKRAKLSELMDSCRISWGEVKSIGKRKLTVEYRPLVLEEDQIALSEPRQKKVDYDPEVKPFGSLKLGDHVSLHWNFACDVLSPRQLRNISKYTALDLVSTNLLLAARRRR
ncbi:MAG: DUF6390 family protein [Thaumarchaeota archaeon]|nr:DUF6390 family protein [Nitrososphaerota archaeon]